ncbi:dnaJ homolog subfamily C member 17 isoform X1 [Ictalurus furcatus]|uniref:dnaJ homolog subfamily C member 17 isoform X1 n=1 Tax=Ictalurus furcatus TaxID=66913 RepID=UPI002350EBD1|nr:dnaJ homolog subfamily C member 17 isoform X1 [Ictalurus furcatus]
MASTKEILQMDLYALLGVEGTATEKEVKKAYRQKALTCHPDKNPDNPKAAELFHQLSQALEVLTDAAARAAYDKVRAAKKQAEERNRRLDDRRKKIKLDLEARERQAEAEAQKREEFKITRTLEEEITRLREEGSRQLQEEQRLIQEQIQKEREWRLNAQSTHADFSSAPQDNRKVTPKLKLHPASNTPGRSSEELKLRKLKWKCKKDDDTNGGYSQEVLQGLLQKYGDILNIIVSSKKKGSAVVEFATVRAAELACKNESGLTGTPLKITWLEGQPANADPTAPNNSSQNSLSTERDYESLVLMRMRQAAERQKLIEQMQQEDEEEETVKT